MPSPSPSPTKQPSSPRPALLPSPFTHSDEQISPSVGILPPVAVLATTASIYSPGHEHDENQLNLPSRHENTFGEEEDDGYPELRDEQGASLLPPPDFHPFFTLITDSRSGETYHPRTFYLFSDDDPDVLTTATLHALDAQSEQFPDERGQEGSANEEERYLVVDMTADGTRVQEIKSLASKWAVTGAEVRGAPTFQQEGGAVGEAGAGGEGLMLMIEGMGMDLPGLGNKDEGIGELARKQRAREIFEDARNARSGNVVQGMEELAQGMGSGLGILDKIVGGLE